MLPIIGFIIVFAATLGGFVLAGGHPAVLLHVSEFVVIGGIAIGIVVISTPFSTLKLTMTKVMGALKGGLTKAEGADLLKLLFEIFTLGRKGGVIALEEHLSTPKTSSIFSKYPSFVNNHHRIDFLCNSLRPIVDGRVKPDQLDEVLEHDLEAKEEEADGPIHVLQLVGDSLPGVGIVAAVLGIINTMAAIAEGPEAVGEKVAAALTGTLLGIFVAYGFVNPLTSRIKANNGMELLYFKAIKKGVIAFATGLAPIMAVEISRRCLDHTVQPAADELEEMVKGAGATAS
ncbi:MAG: chemotaxis protein MotA [Chthoniobacter sp.]|jgi:chemotaxis protein MotA|nr:chemotaxis protein MotA [Chthoniobacter sp.]